MKIYNCSVIHKEKDLGLHHHRAIEKKNIPVNSFCVFQSIKYNVIVVLVVSKWENKTSRTLAPNLMYSASTQSKDKQIWQHFNATI